jgi:hypothetical protein
MNKKSEAIEEIQAVVSKHRVTFPPIPLCVMGNVAETWRTVNETTF